MAFATKAGDLLPLLFVECEIASGICKYPENQRLIQRFSGDRQSMRISENPVFMRVAGEFNFTLP